jgi:CRISPR-associated protein Cas2
MARDLFLVCYDISDPKRLQRVHKRVMAYAVGGQKSFYECWLTPAELSRLRQNLAELIDPAQDRAHFFQLDPRLEPMFHGRAKRQSLQPFLIV